MNKITRSISLIALFLIPIFPLFVANSFFFPFITGKAFYFRILVEIAFASWVVLAFLDAKYRPRLNALTLGVTVFTLVALVADLLGVNPIRSIWSNFERMEGWITIIHLWMFFMVATNLFGIGEDGRRMWHRFLNFSLFIGFIVGCYGLIQLFGWAAIHQGSTRIDASLGNAAYMAVYMLMNAGVATYLLFSLRARNISAVFMQWLYGILAVLFSFLLFETATRGTTLGLIGGIMLALALYAIFGKKEPKKSRRRAVMYVIIIILIGFVFWLSRNQPFIKNSEVLNRLAGISWSETTTQARAYIWPMAIKGWTERPILGWGQENFNYVFNADYNPKMWSQEQWFDRAHSVFLDWLIASGLVGFLAYIALYVLVLWGIWRSTLTIAEKSVFTGLIAGYAVHNIFVFDNLASYVWFFALLGFAASLTQTPRTKISNAAAGPVGAQNPGLMGAVIGGNKNISPELVEYVVLPVAIIALVAGLYFFDVRAIQANTRLIGALQSCAGPTPDVASFEKVMAVNVYIGKQEAREQFLSCADSVLNNQQLSGPTKQAFYGEALKDIQDQTAASPKDARMYVLGGSFLNNLGQFDAARPILEKGHALTPAKQVVDFELATNYLNSGKNEQAVALLKSAYDGDPTYPQAKISYTIGLIILGKEAEAHRLFGNDPALFETEQVAGAYASLKQYDKAIALYKKLIVASPTDINLRTRLAQVQYTAGMIQQAIDTIRGIEKDHPELKTQIEATVKSIQK